MDSVTPNFRDSSNTKREWNSVSHFELPESTYESTPLLGKRRFTTNTSQGRVDIGDTIRAQQFWQTHYYFWWRSSSWGGPGYHCLRKSSIPGTLFVLNVWSLYRSHVLLHKGILGPQTSDLLILSVKTSQVSVEGPQTPDYVFHFRLRRWTFTTEVAGPPKSIYNGHNILPVTRDALPKWPIFYWQKQEG